MSFPAVTDHYSLADGTALIATSDDDGASASNLQITGQNGSLIVDEMYGERLAPTVNYEIADAVEWAADAHALGDVSTSGGKKFALESVTIATAGGAAPTMSASGKEVHSGAATGCVFKIPGFKLLAAHHAQVLFSAFSFTGTGVHLTQANYNIRGTIGLVDPDGVIIGFDITNGRITADLTFRATGTVAPTVAPGTGWEISTPLKRARGRSDRPTYTIQLRKVIDKTEPSAT